MSNNIPMENKNVITEESVLNLIDSLSWASHVTSMNISYMIGQVKIILLVQNQASEWGDIPSKSKLNQYLLSNYYMLYSNICFPNCQW